MTIGTLTDDLIDIACASPKDEMRQRLDALLKDKASHRDEVAEKAKYLIGLFRLQAKALEAISVSANAARLGLRESIESTRKRAAELRMEADEFEKAAIAAGLLHEAPPRTGRGLLSGLVVSDEDIEAAKRSVLRDHDNAG